MNTPEQSLPAGMVAYGPEHPDYPNAPKDWDGEAAFCRDGAIFRVALRRADHRWKHIGLGSDFIAYTRADQSNDSLGRFGHHPDPATDFEIEVQALESIVTDREHGLRRSEPWPGERLACAMTFKVGGVETAVEAKALLRDLEPRLAALADQSRSVDQGREGLKQAAERVQRRVGEWDSLEGHEPRDRFAAFGENLRHDAMTLVVAALTTTAGEARQERVTEGAPHVRETARVLSNIALIYLSAGLPGSNAEKNRATVNDAVRMLEGLAWMLEASGDEDEANRLLDVFAYHAGIRAIDPPRLASFPRDVAVRAILAHRVAAQSELVAENARLREALEPFATKAEQFSAQPDGMVRVQIDFAHFRRARTALGKEGAQA